MVSDLFLKLRNDRKFFMPAKTGKDFEDNIAEGLSQMGFTKIRKERMKKERLQELKDVISQKYSEEYLNVESNEKNQFAPHPCGKQDYPDFLVFTGKKVIPIEIKYSSKNHGNPVWNSNIPKPNGFYIFGSHERRDITFFCGADVIEKEQLKKMHDFFAKTKEMQEKFNEELYISGPDKYRRGFTIYVRKAFEQHSSVGGILDYFKHPDRKQVELKAIKRIKALET